MNKLMPQDTADRNGITQPVSEQVDFPLISHPAGNNLVSSRGYPKNVRFAVADKNGGLMAKLSESFFNYLRNRCL